jgi:dihydroflavonol-4-reductase
MKPPTLVVGATGFLGARVVRALDVRDYPILGLRRPERPTWHVGDVDIDWRDVEDFDDPAFEEALEDCMAVIDCGGRWLENGSDLDARRRREVGRLRQILDASLACGVRGVVYVSTFATLGFSRETSQRLKQREPDLAASEGEEGEERDPEERRESDFYTPGTTDSAYAEATASAEAEIYRYILEGLPVTVAIPGAIFGPGDIGPDAGELLVRIAREQLPASPDGTINAVDVRDVADGVVGALEQGRPGRRYILGGDNVEFEQFVEQCADVAGVSPPDRRLPDGWTDRLAQWADRAADVLPVDAPSWSGLELLRHSGPLSSKRARGELNYGTRPLETTLQESLQWFRSNGYV